MERKKVLFEVFARDLQTDRILMQPHEVIAANAFEAIQKSVRFFKLFLDVKRVRIDVNEIQVLESR